HAAYFALCATLLASACSTPDTALVPATPARSVGNPLNTRAAIAFSFAVIGDMPYGPAKRDSIPMLIDLIYADPKVEAVIHLGDIKAGSKTPCTAADFADIRSLFDTFKDPFIYTPGDNEWTDCH